MTRSLQLLRTLTGSRALLAPLAGACGSAAVSASLASSALAAPSAASRGLRSSAVSLGVGSHMSDNDPVVLELEKRRNLSGKPLPGGGGVPGAEGWNEALASDSEAVVKADRSGVESMEKLTAFTIKRVREQNGDAFVAEELREMEAEAEITAARQQPVVDAAGRR